MNTNRKAKTHFNKNYRVGLTVNSRRYKGGDPIEYADYIDENDREIVKYVDTVSADGGTMTPFNILCNCTGACAIRSIVVDGDDTTVIFADGDKVVLKRYGDDKYDRVTAVLWALGQKVFGANVAKQINSALKYRTIDVAAIREKKTKKVEA